MHGLWSGVDVRRTLGLVNIGVGILLVVGVVAFLGVQFAFWSWAGRVTKRGRQERFDTLVRMNYSDDSRGQS